MNVTGGSNTDALTIGRAAIRLKMDDGLPDYEGIVPAFEPSRLKPVSAIEFSSDVDLDVSASIVIAGQTISLNDLGTSKLTASLKDGKFGLPQLGFSTGTLIDAMRSQLSQATSFTSNWSDISTFADGFQAFAEALIGDLDSQNGLIDLTIPGVGQSIEDMTGLKDALRFAIQTLQDSKTKRWIMLRA